MSNSIDIRSIRKTATPSGKVSKPVHAEDGKTFWKFLNTEIQLGPGPINDRVKEEFYLQLGTLLEAGVDIRTILEMLTNEQKKKKRAAVFKMLLSDITAGMSLSAALQKTEKFSKYEYYSILIGEESGKLIHVLKDLATYFQKKIRQRRQIVGALTYPVVVLSVAFGAVFFMVGYVVPMFSDVFKRFGSDLPAVTKAVITISVFLKKYAKVFVFLSLSLAIIGYFQREKPWFRKYVSNLIIKVPIIGNILHKIFLARFANTMALLSGAKIPLVQSIGLTKQMIGFYPIEEALDNMEKQIVNGVSLQQALSEHTFFPTKMVALIKVGEQVNQLELFFNRIAEQYAGEVEHQTGMLSKLLEPIIIVVLGLVVGVILIAMYLPMFKLGQPL